MKINRQIVYEKHDGHCAYCGCEITIKQMQVDHIRPKHNYHYGDMRKIPDYEPDDTRNLNPACRFCNYKKDTFTLEEFRKELSLQVTRARKTSYNFRMAERYGQIIINETPIRFYFEKEPSND